jgi:3-methyladenine DNA glycosylase AlkD
MSLNLLKQELKNLADPKKAKILQRFFKTGKGEYAEGDIFLGITVPKQREVVKKYLNLELSDISNLLKSKIHEHRLVALLILVEKYSSPSFLKRGLGGVEKSKIINHKSEIYNFYLAHTKYINNWDLVDCSASNIVGAHLYTLSLEGRGQGVRVANNILTKLAKSKNLWERRIAIIATFYFIKNKSPKLTLKISELLLQDNHDLIHKACGWMLREVGKKCGGKYLTVFLDKHIQKMPRTMLRYSIERLPKKLKDYYLNK